MLQLLLPSGEPAASVAASVKTTAAWLCQCRPHQHSSMGSEAQVFVCLKPVVTAVAMC